LCRWNLPEVIFYAFNTQSQLCWLNQGITKTVEKSLNKEPLSLRMVEKLASIQQMNEKLFRKKA
jgi:hypothetical protein